MTINEKFGAAQNLQAQMDRAGGPVKMLRSSQIGPFVFPGVAAEFTNWRDEQRAWHENVALLEQSYHMSELHIRGRQGLQLLADFSLNKYSTFPVLRGKQIVCADDEGYMIGDAILFKEEDDFFRVVGPPPVLDWLQFNAETGGYSVDLFRDDNAHINKGPRSVFRFQLQGPFANDLMRKVHEGEFPELKFFNIGIFQIAGCTVRALRHGMAGEPGYEVYGEWEDQAKVREAVERAGEEFGLRKVGALAYSATGTQSGWMPMPVPAVYHGDKLRAFREWLGPMSIEALGSLGGSLYSDDIRDYYVDPIECGYAGLIEWDRDFVGRDALKKRVDEQTREKVSFVWKPEDVMDIQRAAMYPNEGEDPAIYIRMPSGMYSTFHCDDVRVGGKTVGNSQWSCFASNANTQLSLGVVEKEFAKPGTKLTLVWGEPGSVRNGVGAHSVREIEVEVAPAPFFEKVIKTKK